MMLEWLMKFKHYASEVSQLSRETLQRARSITYAQLALQATLFAYRTLFRFRYADPITMLA